MAPLVIDAGGWVSPVRKTRHHTLTGGRPFSRGNLYLMLSDPIYIDQIRHKGTVYPGQHPPIIDPKLWQAVQDRLLENLQGKRRRTYAKVPMLLATLVFDAAGQRLRPTYTRKGEKQYRYYFEQPSEEVGVGEGRESNTPLRRWPAQELESAVVEALIG